MAKGADTLQAEIWQIENERQDDRTGRLEKALDEHKTALGKLVEKYERLQTAFNDERVSSAKSLGASAGGGAGVVGVVELIQYLVQSGAAG